MPALIAAVKSWKSWVGATLALLVAWVFLLIYSTLNVAYRDHQNLVVATGKTCAVNAQERPKDATQPSVRHTKEPPKIITQIKQNGKDNTANPGSIAAPINQGPCGVVQNGGSNNVASPTCIPPDRHLTGEQIESVRKVIQSFPDSVKVMVKTIDGNGESLRYAQQFQDIAVQCGRSGNPKAVILGMMWRPVPVGLWIVARSDENPVSSYRTELTEALSLKKIQVQASRGDWVMDEELYIVVGERPQ